MNDTLRIFPSTLAGVVTPSGAKNSALKFLAASLLTDDPLVLKRFPVDLLDIQVHLKMLERLGRKCRIGESEVSIYFGSPVPGVLEWGERSIRNTLLLMGAMLARAGHAEVPLPGGCQIGERSFDIHLDVIRALGGHVEETRTGLRASIAGRLRGADIHLRLRSTGATENAILMGCLAEGTTNVWSPHVRPEVIDLIELLRAMGARISVFGQERIEIRGVDRLHGATHTTIVDSMEAITWVVAAAVTGGEVEIRDFPFSDLEVAMIHLEAAGVRAFRRHNDLLVRPGSCYPIEISTGPHPGINSDMQPILAAFGACATGESRIVDLRFPGRYGYASEMEKLGVSVGVVDNLLRINGSRDRLKGAEVTAIDLRAGACLAVCGLVAHGSTSIRQAWQIMRGYSGFVDKLRALGARVEVGP